MKEAVAKVKSKEISMHLASEVFDIPYTTLQRIVSSHDDTRHHGGQSVIDKVSESFQKD